MKLKLEDKLKIIELYKDGFSISKISKQFKVSECIIKKIERQYREHGIASFKEKEKNSKYPVTFKMEIIQRVLDGESISSIAAELCISRGMMYSWLNKYKELGYNSLIEKKKGRPPKMKPKNNETKLDIPMDEKDKRIKELEERNAQLEMENDLLKKLKALVQQRQQQQNKKK